MGQAPSSLLDGEPIGALARARTGLLRNASKLLLGETVARVFGFVALIVMTRALGPAGYGLVALGTTLVLCFGLLVDAGTETLGLRDISIAPRDFRRVVEPALGLRLAMSLVGGALLVLAVMLAARSGSDRLALGLFALVLPATALNLRWMVLGLGGSGAVATGNALSQLVVMVGVVVLVTRRHDAPAVALLVTAGELLSAVVVLVWVGRRHQLVQPRIDTAAWRATFRDGLPLTVFQFSRTVINFFDLLLIGVVLGRAAAGVYAAAYKPVLFASLAIGLFHVSLLSSYSAIETSQRSRLLSHAVRLSVAVTVAGALLLSLLAGPVINLLYGHPFARGTAALAILAWTIPLGAVGGAYGQVLIATGRQRSLMRQGAWAAGFNIAGNAVAIPLGGITAAAAVTLATQLILTTWNVRAVQRSSPRTSSGTPRRSRPE